MVRGDVGRSLVVGVRVAYGILHKDKQAVGGERICCSNCTKTSYRQIMCHTATFGERPSVRDDAVTRGHRAFTDGRSDFIN